MKLVIGTSERLAIIDDGNISTIKGGHFYGVTFNENCLFGCQRSSNGTKLNTFDKNFKQVKVVNINSIHAVHQALYDTISHMIFITNTRKNILSVYDPNKEKVVKEYNWTGQNYDTHHLNSIFRYPKNNALYVYEHSIKEEEIQEKRIAAARRLSENFKPCQDYKMGIRGHNVLVFENYVYIIDSFGDKQKSRFLRMHINGGPIETMICMDEYDGFGGRGLAFSDDYIIIGLTKLASRMKRHDPKHPGFIAIYNRKFEKINEIMVPNCGQLYEIRFLDRVDYAHNEIVFLK